MLKYMVLLAGALVVLAATNEVQARGFRRSRGGCPNGQCYAAIPASPTKAVAIANEASGTVVEAPVTPAVEAPVAVVSATVTVSNVTVAPRRSRFAVRARFFRRR